MAQLFLVGIAAGAASALLAITPASGSPFALVLYGLVPLPILIATIGWSFLAGLIAAFTAATALILVVGASFFFQFLIGTALPAWWLGYLAMLGRPGTHGGDLEWYPPGRLVVWAAVLATTVVTLAVLNAGADPDVFRAGARRFLERIMRVYLGTPEGTPLQIPEVPDANQFLDLMALMVPPMGGLALTTINLINLWLAGRIVKVSGRLRRPWPDLAAMRFPPIVAAAFAVAFAAHFVPGLVSVISGVFAAAMLLAYAILGFAIVHKITADLHHRVLILAGVYAVVVAFRWPILVMVLLGLADAIVDIRERFATKPGPPAPLT
jgi:Predicted membrane protein (DUF2232)